TYTYSISHMSIVHQHLVATQRVFHFPFSVDILILYLLSVFLTLLACWRISRECFREPEARWAGVLTVAALLTIPVAGTSLYIADQYLTSRSLVTFAVLFAIESALNRRRTSWFVWSAIALCLHPLMAAFGISLSVIVWWMGRGILKDQSFVAIGAAFPVLNLLPVASHAYQQAVETRSYFFILRWQWYEWVGAVAPLLLLWLIGRWSARRSLRSAQTLANAVIVYSIIYLVATLIITIPARFETAARLQPM